MKYINKQYMDAIVEIQKREKGKVIFTGSIALILQGRMNREPQDIDCFTEARYYGDLECMKLNHQSSNKFWDSEGKLIEVVKGRTDNGVYVDYMYRKDLPPTVNCAFKHGKKIYTLRLATYKSINDIKRDYVKRGGEVQKHVNDLTSDDLPF